MRLSRYYITLSKSIPSSSNLDTFLSLSLSFYKLRTIGTVARFARWSAYRSVREQAVRIKSEGVKQGEARMEAGTVVVSKGEPRPPRRNWNWFRSTSITQRGPGNKHRQKSEDRSCLDKREGGRGPGLHPWPGQPAPVAERRLCFQPPEIPGEFEQRERVRRGVEDFSDLSLPYSSKGRPSVTRRPIDFYPLAEQRIGEG